MNHMILSTLSINFHSSVLPQKALYQWREYYLKLWSSNKYIIYLIKEIFCLVMCFRVINSSRWVVGIGARTEALLLLLPLLPLQNALKLPLLILLNVTNTESLQFAVSFLSIIYFFIFLISLWMFFLIIKYEQKKKKTKIWYWLWFD